MDLIEVLNLIIITVIVLAIFTTFLLIFALRLSKSSNKRTNELITIQKENLEVQKAILSKIEELRKDSDFKE